MMERPPKRGFAARPGNPDSWVRAPELSTGRTQDIEFTARLTINVVTPVLRGPIKIAAFRCGLTMADMLCAMLDREFPAGGGAAS